LKTEASPEKDLPTDTPKAEADASKALAVQVAPKLFSPFVQPNVIPLPTTGATFLTD
jgi:hypothetical protein